jgi:tetratricopeptide (TPR) repeat protein
MQEYRNWKSIRQEGTYRIFCLGESTTGGQYPPFLEETLNQRDIGIKFSVIDGGSVGFNTTTIISRLEKDLDKFKPQMLIAMMGINDGGERAVWENNNIAKIASFLKSFRVYKLIKLIYLHAQSKIREEQSRRREAGGVRPRLTASASLSHSLNWEIKSRISSSIPSSAQPLEITGLSLKDDKEYVKEAELYSIDGKFADAEKSFKKAIAINPRNNNAYGLLVKLYWDYEHFSRSKDFFEKTIKANPLNEEAYYWMALGYKEKGDYSSTEKLLKKTLAISPGHFPAVSELTLIYRMQGRYPEAECLLKKYLKQYPNDEYIYSLSAVFYEETGKYRSADECYRESGNLMMRHYNPVTRNNYLKLKGILDKRGIKLVCMQYPVRMVKPLKEIFPDKNGIIFVDNEKIFKDAIRESSYTALFKDNFAGDFGHCTDKGNRLIAENAANVILREVFNK